MFSRFSIVVAACLIALCVVDFATAQYGNPSDPKPLSNSGGFSGQAMSQIYREDVGQGFSSSSLNLLALQNARARVPYVGQSTTPSGGGRVGLGLGASNAGKPFSGYSPDPTVSPYLNLFREDLEGGSDLNYNTLVRPMLQQQAVNQQVQRQALEFQRKLQSVAAQNDYNPQGAKDVFPTGHQTAFRYFGHFHPTAGRPRAR